MIKDVRCSIVVTGLIFFGTVCILEASSSDSRLKVAVDRIKEGSSYDAWVRDQKIPCHPFKSGIGVESHEDIWCYKCEEEVDDKINISYSFYYDLTQNACTLQQVIGLSNDSNDLSPIVSQLSKLLGSPSTPKKDIYEEGSASWKNVSEWKTKDSLAYAFKGSMMASPDDKTAAGFLWRWEPLRTRQSETFPPFLYPREADFDGASRKTPQALRESLAACHEAGLAGCEEAVQAIKQNSEDSMGKAIREAVKRRQTMLASDSKYPALMYWISRLLPLNVGTDSPYAKLLKALGFAYDYSSGGNDHSVIWLSSSPVKDLVENHLDSHWGHLAFLEALQSGWHFDSSCGADYNIVIEKGLGFLSQNPKTEISPNVILEIGKAYDTLWSDWKSGGGSTELQAEDARKKAIHYYKEYLKNGGPHTFDLAEVIYKLEQGLDTAQRSYLCYPE